MEIISVAVRSSRSIKPVDDKAISQFQAGMVPETERGCLVVWNGVDQEMCTVSGSLFQ